MSDDRVNVGVGFESDGSEERLAAAIANSIDNAFKKLGPRLAREFGQQFSKAFSKASSVGDAFDGIRREGDRLDDQFRSLSDRLDAMIRTANAARGAFGDAFDPRLVDGLESAMEQIVRLQDEIAKGGGDPALLDQTRQLGRLIQSELTTARTEFQQGALAAREAQQNITRDTRQESRERIAIINSEKARFVAETQAASSRELATIRSSAQQQVAVTRAAAQQRAAAYELVGRVVRSVERSLRAVFQGTANVASAALRGITRAAGSTASGIRSVFSSSNRGVRNSFQTTNQSISNSYRSSFRRNTNIVNNELGTQERRIRQFAREATEEISTIGIGALGGLALVGVAAGRALRGGFERAATLEDSDRALTALLGSAEEAAQLTQDVLDIVTGTPFKLDQFANAATQLVAFNIEAEKVPEYLNAIANAAAVRGGNAGQTIDSLVRVFGQVSAAGRLTGEDLNQLSEAGVPALQILGNAYGEIAGDMRDMISDGAVPANEALEILTQGILKGSDGVNGATAAFEGLAQGLGQTLRGSIGNFSAAFDRLGATIITKFQPLLINFVQSATELVDVLASAFGSLGDAIADSPVFRVLGNVFENLGEQIETAGKRIKPVFDFIAEGLVTFATAAGAIAGLRRVPLVVNALAFAFRRLLSPLNLLIGAGILVGGFVNRLVRSSPELGEALSNLGNALGRVATVIADLAADAFGALATVIEDFVTPAVEFLSDKIVAVAVPALDAISRFIVDQVLPPLRRFARFVRTDVVPVLGEILAKAIDFAKRAFSGLVNFIRDEVIPFVGPILSTAVNVGRQAFETAYDFLANTFLPFVRSDLVPVLAGLGGALAALATGNVPLAALLAGGGLAVAAFRNDELRDSIVEFFAGIVERVRESFKTLFDGDVLRTIAVGALKVAERVGRVLGDALTDRRLITAAAGIGAAAVALAAAFTAGFVRGVIENIPELISLLSDAFRAAFDQIFSDPKLFAGVAVALGSAALIASLVASARRTGRIIATAMTQGVNGGLQAGRFGFGSGTSSFFQGLFGGPRAIEAAATKAVQAYSRTVARQVTRDQSLLRSLGRGIPGLTPERNALGQFTGRLAGTSANLLDTTTGIKQLQNEFGKAAVAGLRFRKGLSDIRTGLKGLTSGAGSLSKVREGVGQIGTALREAGPQIATAAGVIAGGAFAASFVSQALFDIESSGVDKLQAGLGLAASAITTGAIIGGPAGVAAGSAVAGFGLITSKLQSNQREAERAKARMQEYVDLLRSIDPETTEGLTSIQDRLIEGLSTEALQGLNEAGVSIRGLADQLADGSIAERLGDVDRALIDLGGASEEWIRKYSPLGAQLLEGGASADQVASILRTLSAEANAAASASERLAAEGQALASTGAFSGLKDIAQQTGDAAREAALAAEASQTFKDRLRELNDVQIGEAKRQVDEAKSALDEAKGAADDAKQALIDFLTGNTEALTLEQATNQGILNIASIAESINQLPENAAQAGGIIGAQFAVEIQKARDEAAEILSAGEFTSKEQAAAALQPIIDAGAEVGGGAGDAIAAAINEVIANFDTAEGQSLLSDLFDAEAAVAEAQSTLNAEESYLNFRTRLDPETVPNLVAEAEAAAQEVNESFVAGIEDGETGAKTAAAQVGRGAGDAAGGTGPKGRFNSAGRELMRGLSAGIEAQAATVAAAAARAARAAADRIRSEWEIESPSKVAMEIGEFFGEGLAEGIAESEPTVLAAAVRVANKALAGLRTSGKNAAREIGRGLAEEGGSFVGSVRSVLDNALNAALDKVGQFREVGKEIAVALFGQQGLRPGSGRLPGGGTTLTQAVLDRLDQQLEAIRATENFAKLREEFGPRARTFSESNALGRINRSEFLTRGLDLREFIQGQIEAGLGVPQAVFMGQRFRDDLVVAARRAGASTADINSLLNTLGLTDTQLRNFIQEVNKATQAVEASRRAEEERIKAEERQANQPAPPIQQPIFRDLVVQTATGDPEATALYVANRVALGIRR